MSADQPPIGDYALLSDCFSAALVSRENTVDWACLTRFDAGSCFGRVLDWERGGTFALSVRDRRETSRRYLDGSLVLSTVVTAPGGRLRITEAFAVRPGGRDDPAHVLLRVVDGIEGQVELDVLIEPRFDYGAMRPWLRRHDGGASDVEVYSAVGGDDALVISSGVALEIDREAYRLAASCSVAEGDRLRFSVASQLPHRLEPDPLVPEDFDAMLDATLSWWREWSEKTRTFGVADEEVRRSAVVLKALTCAPTGAIVAAPTSSLPEQIGGTRNWDYRYSWVRDSTLTLDALASVGHTEVAEGFRAFLLRSAAGHAEDLQIMFGCYGEHELPERELDLAGYRGSRPVRVGNGAAKQIQLDVYGHILDAADHWALGDGELDDDEWRFIRDVVDVAAARWEEPDQGIWEARDEPRHYTHSKVLLWVALDRGVRIATRRTDAEDVVERWGRQRDRLRANIEERGVCAGGWFTQSYGDDAVDAALLRLPMVGFVDAEDERMRRTVERIQERLAVPPHGFVRRYDTDAISDGVGGGEGVFLMCSFWLVAVLHMQGRRDEAAALFERLLETGNDLGLYAEEYDSEIEELLGNFPQAFTHTAIINAARRLSSD